MERVLNGLGLSDTPSGRRNYRATVERRILDMHHSSEPWKADAAWDKIRRGWCFGDSSFRQEVTGHLSGTLKSKKRESFSGAALRQHDAEAAERVLVSGMKALGVTDESLANQIKGSPEKYALAWLVRKNTCVRNGWIKQRLKMGSSTNFSAYLRRIETAKQGYWGYDSFQRIKNING